MKYKELHEVHKDDLHMQYKEFHDDFEFYWELMPEYQEELKNETDERLREIIRYHEQAIERYYGESPLRRKTIELLYKILYGKRVLDAI